MAVRKSHNLALQIYGLLRGGGQLGDHCWLITLYQGKITLADRNTEAKEW